MKFYVTRTTEWWGVNPPCENVTLLNPNRKEWEIAHYGIEINTLEELIAFIEEVGYDIVILKTDKEESNGEKYSDYEIEIYDNYRE